MKGIEQSFLLVLPELEYNMSLCMCVCAQAREINWVLFSRVVRQLGKCRHMAGIYKVFTKTSVVFFR